VHGDEIKVSVERGMATLTGTVGTWIGWGEADKDARRSGATGSGKPRKGQDGRLVVVAKREEGGRHGNLSSVVLWIAFMFLFFVGPVSYGWGYRKWGAPYPRYIQRRLGAKTGTVAISPSPELQHWGWGRAT